MAVRYNDLMDRVIISEQMAAMAGYLSTVPEVVLGFLFGSYARGQGRPDSDVDCAVLLADDVPPGAAFDLRLGVMDGLARAIGRDDVDVAILNEAPLALAYRVLRDGKLLFCRDHAAYVQYRVKTLNLYFDFAPLLERWRVEQMLLGKRIRLQAGKEEHEGTVACGRSPLGGARFELRIPRNRR